MKFIKRFLIYPGVIVMTALVLVQCKEKVSNDFSVTINYKNLDKMMPRDSMGRVLLGSPAKSAKIMLEEIPYGGEMTPVILDSSTLNGKDGKLVLKGNGKEESIFQLAVENGPVLLLINDDKNISVDIDLSKGDNFYTLH